MNLDPVIIIALIAVAYIAFSLFVQRKIVNYKRVKELQKETNIKMKELRALGSSVEKEVLDLKQKEMQDLASESMKHQLKGTLIILPLYFLLYYFVLPLFFPASLTVTVLSYTLPYKTFFIATSFVLGILSSIFMAAYERMTARRNQPATNPAQ